MKIKLVECNGYSRVTAEAIQTSRVHFSKCGSIVRTYFKVTIPNCRGGAKGKEVKSTVFFSNVENVQFVSDTVKLADNIKRLRCSYV